jgi:hypothetical protein
VCIRKTFAAFVPGRGDGADRRGGLRRERRAAGKAERSRIDAREAFLELAHFGRKTPSENAPDRIEQHQLRLLPYRRRRPPGLRAALDHGVQACEMRIQTQSGDA